MSPPFRPPSVASLCSSAVVAGAPLVIYPLRTRHHDASHHHQSATERTTSSTTRLPQSGRPPPQPVCHRADDQPPQPTIPLQPVCCRADDLLYNPSAAEQTTSSTTRLLQSRRPLPQSVCYRADDLLHNPSAAEQTTSPTTCLLQSRRPPTSSLQPSCCRRPLLQPVYGCRAIGNQTIEDRRRTAGVPQAHRRRCTARVAIVGDRGRGLARVTIST
jgi:hypothetical protein